MSVKEDEEEEAEEEEEDVSGCFWKVRRGRGVGLQNTGMFMFHWHNSFRYTRHICIMNTPASLTAGNVLRISRRMRLVDVPVLSSIGR